MKFSEVVNQAIALLEESGRVSYRALKREFDLDDEALEDLIEAIRFTEPRIGDEETIAEIIYWERPQGGRVFHTGSIATAWGVYHDETMSKLLKNVLHHFEVRARETP